MNVFICSTGAGIRTAAESHKEEGDLLITVNSMENLIDSIVSLPSKDPIKKMAVYAHAAPGKMQLGGSVVTADNLDTYVHPSLPSQFAANAQVSFMSCEIAGNAEGECWLAKFGRVFLRVNGGQVWGSTKNVISHPWGEGSPTGTWVGAKIKPGGVATLQNQTYLEQDKILRRMCEVQRLMKVEKARAGGPRINYDPTFLDADIQKLSRGTITSQLKGYEYLFILCDYLDSTERSLKRLGYEIEKT